MAKIEIGNIDFGTQKKYDLTKVSRELFRLMLNNPLYDYSSLEETFSFKEMALYGPDEICKAVDELTGKEEYNNLLLEISKPYGKVAETMPFLIRFLNIHFLSSYLICYRIS